MKNRNVVSVLSLLTVLFVLVGLASGQTSSGRIEGTISDSSGAVVAGASLTATNQATSLSYKATSGEAGLFVFPVLPVGDYKVVASKPGFADASMSAKVAVGGKIDLPITLSVAGSAQKVEVTSEAPLVETTRTQVSDAVNERAIKELPVNGRNFIDFVLLTPGVTRDVRTGDISFAGQRGTLNSLTVDGADNNNTFFGQTTGRAGSGRAPYQFSQDSVQEFQVASNAYSAEFGRAGGAVINVVTKSGTNQFHGTGFEFFRDQSMNAYDPIQKFNATLPLAKPLAHKNKYHWNQFGGNVGGPIIKDRAFFFFDYDGQRNSQPNIITYSPPTLAAPTIYETTALNYLAARAGSYTRTLNQNTYLLKLDTIITPKHQISARWNRQLFTGGNFENGGFTNSLEHTGASSVHSDTITTQLTSTLTNTLVNVLRFTYLRDKEPGAANSDLPEAVVKQGGSTLLTLGRNSFSPRETTIHREQYADNVTWVAGRHTFKFGADAIVDKILNFFPGNFSGAYTFNTLDDFGRSLSGVATTGTVIYAQAFAGAGTTGPETHPDMVQIGAFVQDDWRVLNNLTVNLGLRYDDQSVKQPSVQNPAALALGFDTSKIDISKNEVGPRIGFAWTPYANGKMVVRGGYGIFYGNTPSILIGTAMSNNAINVGTINFNNALAPSYPNTKCGAPVPTPNCAAPTGGTTGSAPSIYVFQRDFKNPQVQQANFGTEFALSNDVSLSLTYLWVKGTHLQRTADRNLGTPSVASITDINSGQAYTFLKYPTVRPNTAFSRISEFESNSASNYNGFSAELRKRFSRNFQASVSYTWSHVIDDAPDATAVVPFSSGDDAKIAMYPTIPSFDRAAGSNDLRHRFVASYVWDLNYGKDLPTAVRWITSGWQFSGIVLAATGQPYSGIVNGDLNGDSNTANDRLPGTARNQFRFPSQYSWDPRVLRTVKIRESLGLQIFAEAFNILNHSNINGVRNTISAYATTACGSTPAPCLKLQTPTTNPTGYFGLPTSSAGQRILQLGAKINF